MTDRAARNGPWPSAPAPNFDPAAVTRDWIAIWQSELTALATDREMQEGWRQWVAFCAAASQAVADLLPRAVAAGPPRDTPGSARSGPPAGAAPAAAASDARDAAIERLAERVAELERQLAIGRGPEAGAS